MNLLSMTNEAQSNEFYKKNCIFQTRVRKFGDCLGVWKLATNAKFQLNISKIMPAKSKTLGQQL